MLGRLTPCEMLGEESSPSAFSSDTHGGASLSKQLAFYQNWQRSLAHAQLQAVPLHIVQSAVQVVVSGFPDSVNAEVRSRAYA